MGVIKQKRRRAICMIIPLSIVLILVGFVAFEVLYVVYAGSVVARPTIPRDTQTIGKGPELTYVIMGDSTAVAQGGDYQRGYAVASAYHLAEAHTVHCKNVAVSGARAHDVYARQLPQAVMLKPDIVLIAVGANDVTHLTSVSSVGTSLQRTITGLREANPQVVIVLTGSPDMGSVPRFAQPLRRLAGAQTARLNNFVAALAREDHVVFAPIAQKTGPIFRKHPELFAVDKFHPNDQGYALWIPVINKALDQAM